MAGAYPARKDFNIMSIWDNNDSRYGTYPDETKPVSDSTMRRWTKENRTKNRKAIALVKDQKHHG